ncbi:unnamed protein product [Pylaiella littoralis]
MLSVSAFEYVDWILPFRSEEPTNGKGRRPSRSQKHSANRIREEDGGCGGVRAQAGEWPLDYMIVLMAAVALSHVTVLGIRH